MTFYKRSPYLIDKSELGWGWLRTLLHHQRSLLSILPARPMRIIDIMNGEVGSMSRICKIYGVIRSMPVFGEIPAPVIIAGAMAVGFLMHTQISAVGVFFYVDLQVGSMLIICFVDHLRTEGNEGHEEKHDQYDRYLFGTPCFWFIHTLLIYGIF